MKIRKKITLLLLIGFSLTFFSFKDPGNEKNKAAFMRHAKFGILVHYLNFLQNQQMPWNMGKKTSWDSCVSDFNVDIFAKQMHDIGAGYVIFSVDQGTRYMCVPDKTFEDLTGYVRGDATTNVDLIGKLSDALSKYNIRLMLYVTGDGTFKDTKSSIALQNPILKWKENGNKFIVTNTWVENWGKVLQDISMRYGNKISGWWIDGAYQFHGYNDTLIGILANDLRSGNPDCALAFNPGPRKRVIFYTKWDDYTTGESEDFTDLPSQRNGKINDKQWQVVSFLGSNWQQPNVRYKNQDSLVTYINKVKAYHGAVTLDVCLLRDGSISPEQYSFLKQVSSQIVER